jgi:hypothetical protein
VLGEMRAIANTRFPKGQVVRQKILVILVLFWSLFWTIIQNYMAFLSIMLYDLLQIMTIIAFIKLHTFYGKHFAKI